MAIENLSIAHSDLEIRGGLKYVGVGLLSNVASVAFADDHQATLTSTDDTAYALFDLKQGTGSLSTSGSKEGGTIMFEHTISFYVPNCSGAHLKALESMRNQHLVVVTQDHNETPQQFVVGISDAYSLDDSTLGNVQMIATLSSIEGGTGAALGDENGVTVTITCMSGELPRICGNTVTVDTSTGAMTVDNPA